MKDEPAPSEHSGSVDSADDARRVPEQQRSRARVEKILDVAAQLIASDGIDAMTMSMLADTADVSLPSIYRYFPNKQSILATLLERYTQRVRDATFVRRGPVGSADEARTVITEAFDRYWRFVLDDPVYMSIWSAGLADPELAAVIIEAGRQNAAIFVERLAPVMSASPEAATTIAFMTNYLAASTARMAVLIDERQRMLMLELFTERVAPVLFGLDG